MRHFDTSDAPHLRSTRSVQKVMGTVILALLPAIMASVWFFGPGVFWQITLACGLALIFEFIMLRLRKTAARDFMADLSAPLTAILFALAMPPLAPWWLIAIGMFAAIVVAKHLYGGLGLNLFNPAMVGVAVVILAFPYEYTQWLAPSGLRSDELGVWQSLQVILQIQVIEPQLWDSIAQATPLDVIRMGVREGASLSEIRQDPIFGDFGGRGWEWIANFYFLGGLFLLYKRIIPWQTPLATLVTTIALSLPFYLLDSDFHPFPLNHVFSGAMVMAAFFIVTDPVTGCRSARGRLIFGMGVAIITLAIRRWGAYPDGIAFAVLLMNAFAPLIDRFTAPPAFGAGSKGAPDT